MPKRALGFKTRFYPPGPLSSLAGTALVPEVILLLQKSKRCPPEPLKNDGIPCHFCIGPPKCEIWRKSALRGPKSHLLRYWDATKQFKRFCGKVETGGFITGVFRRPQLCFWSSADGIFFDGFHGELKIHWFCTKTCPRGRKPGNCVSCLPKIVKKLFLH